MLRRVLLATALTVTTAGAALGVAAPAAQAAVPRPVGAFRSVVQDTVLHTVTVTGWAYDARAPRTKIWVLVWIDGKYVGASAATQQSGYTLTVHWSGDASRVGAKSSGAGKGPLMPVGSGSAKRVAAGPGARIVAIAARYVGKARYVDGGASPSGFDCSGYTEYAYAQAGVARLPHNANAQRYVRGMRRISAAQARPGDLVFYLSGGSAYHVAIYAGRGMQYAAATPRDGVRYQHVWSSQVEYRTDWH